MIQSDKIVYTKGDQSFEGNIAWDDSFMHKRPGILIAHTWVGQSDFENQKGKALAELGYVALSIDMYGKGRRASGPEEAEELMHELTQDRELLRDRILMAKDTLADNPLVDVSKLGAIGFCFGGKCVLDLARTGIDIKGVVSFHGIYDPPPIYYTDPILSSVLILHGWEDPLATPEQVNLLANELTERNADWQILAFGHTGHAFTNPNAKSPDEGMFYQRSSSDRAWKTMQNFFAEKFA
ncbi:MAG: dienelactone hydrolase family protein [Bacteroidia bacterium]|nr:dienelactone hydrolase family protein [Bacteroidia bacterium]